MLLPSGKALRCGKNGKVSARGQQPHEDLTEEELARYVQELQKHQASSSTSSEEQHPPALAAAAALTASEDTKFSIFLPL
ncbi:hypothetical protein Y1Q_0022112 [Alligator mississippiensis]|uniref:Uncharacterized protein n=1 Tax=Alligator mississippiensis TaxID=8496 RepID=A0A151M4U0_ALLMI|nr:hypothetical protein Y1Q_0022112 [Alligator mississippiensis]